MPVKVLAGPPLQAVVHMTSTIDLRPVKRMTRMMWMLTMRYVHGLLCVSTYTLAWLNCMCWRVQCVRELPEPVRNSSSIGVSQFCLY